MTFDAQRSARYNQSRGYSPAVTDLICNQIGASNTRHWSPEDSQSVFEWQSNHQNPALGADGMFGPRSLGAMIADLLDDQRTGDAVLASAYPHVLPAGVEAPESTSTNPVITFRALLVERIKLRSLGSGWAAQGRFRILIRFQPDVDASRYEYRQFIKGAASTERGTHSSTPATMQNWVATPGTFTDQASAFQMPSGLPTTYTEDAQTINGVVQRYGYRSSPGQKATATQPEDRYLDRQRDGKVYRATDTVGLRDPTSRTPGLRIRQRYDFQGRIIDTSDHNRIVMTRHWRLEGDYIL